MLKNLWLQLQIPQCLEDYVNIDSSVLVPGKPTNEDVVVEVQQKLQVSGNTVPTSGDEDEDEDEVTPAQ